MLTLSRSATFLMTAPIAEDLHIGFADEAWILGTYSMVFAATRELECHPSMVWLS